ncbi:MAG: hypothetical protein ACK5LV_07695 [Lachnospirales bacterium]
MNYNINKKRNKYLLTLSAIGLSALGVSCTYDDARTSMFSADPDLDYGTMDYDDTYDSALLGMEDDLDFMDFDNDANDLDNDFDIFSDEKENSDLLDDENDLGNDLTKNYSTGDAIEMSDTYYGNYTDNYIRDMNATGNKYNTNDLTKYNNYANHANYNNSYVNRDLLDDNLNTVNDDADLLDSDKDDVNLLEEVTDEVSDMTKENENINNNYSRIEQVVRDTFTETMENMNE